MIHHMVNTMDEKTMKGLVKDAVESFVPDAQKKDEIFGDIKHQLPPLSMDDARSKKTSERNSAVLTFDEAKNMKDAEKIPLSMDDARAMKNASRVQMAESRLGSILKAADAGAKNTFEKE